MKKKILFIISNMQTGGVSKSMVSLMNVIDRRRYDVSLMIVSPTGAFMELLPDDLRILSNPKWSALTGRLDGLLYLVKSGSLFLAIGHCIRLVVSALGHKALAARMIAAMMPPLDEEFDTVVDFNGQQQLYYMIDKLKSRKKITFFHNDYKKWPYYFSADKRYYPKVDYIFSVSEQCVNSLKEIFPKVSQKIFLMENISSMSVIAQMAEATINQNEILTDKPSIITIGHVCDRKGSHWAIEAASILKRRGVIFRWYFLGANDDPRFSQLSKELDVDDFVKFIGIKVNPYPFIKNATIVAHTAQFEGRSIALDEAKLLCKPIVVTNFSTVNDQFTDRHNGSICRMNPASIADAVEELLTDASLRQRYVSNLLAERHDNSSEIEKLYRIFDD